MSQSWSTRTHYVDAPWWLPDDGQDRPPLRLTRLGRQVAAIAAAALVVLAFAVGALVRMPIDRHLAPPNSDACDGHICPPITTIERTP